MELRYVAETPGPPAAAFDVVADLHSYPDWLDLVDRVEAAAPADGDGGPAFWVTLRARLGPLARSKRLRMVRTEHRPSDEVRFSRREVDGRQHSPWELTAAVRPAASPVPVPGDEATSEVEVRLHYGGRLWAEPLGSVLSSQVERAVPRLQALVGERG